MEVYSFAWPRRYQEEPYELSVIANAILSGLVAITGPCAVVDAWAAAIIGGVAHLSRCYVSVCFVYAYVL